MSAQLRLSVYAALATMASATALVSVFASYAWVIPVMGGIVIVAGSAALIRSSPLPSALEPIAAAVGILCWVTFLYARAQAHLGVIPGRLALRHLRRAARHGFNEIHRVPTPAPAHHGVVLLAVVGVAAIALVVDLLTVTLRRAALSGLPLLALFTVCAATGHHGVGLPAFVVASIGYLWLLYADNREKVARWGAAVGTGSRARPASAWSTDETSAAAPASLGRRVGAMAIGVGVVVPLLIPGLHTGIGKHGAGGSGDGSGDGNKIVLNPIVSVANDLNDPRVEPLLSYTTSSPDPGYLRLTSLDMFDGSTFSAGSLRATSRGVVSETLPVIPPVGRVVDSTINVSPNFTKLHWLPVQSTVIGVSADDQWRYDPNTATIFSATATGGGLSYTERSIANDPTTAQLSAVPYPGKAFAADVTVPAGISPAVRRLTRQVTAKASTPLGAALAIQSFFTKGGRFIYDTNIRPEDTPNALADFLLHSRRGFCQQFATAMAVMARLAGIPARVAVGFTRGTQQPNHSWLVTTHDAHAWPELYFQGYGWLPFEPTPRADGQAVTPPYAKATSLATSKHPTKTKQSPTPNPSPSSTRAPHGVGGINSAGTGGSGGSRAAAVVGRVALILAALLLVALLLPGATRAVTRRRRWRLVADPARAPAAAWAELRDTAIDLRVPWDDGRSPRQIAATVAGTIRPDAETGASLRRLAHYEERSRYAPMPDPAAVDLRHDVGTVRHAALARLTRRQRVVARVLPRSTLLRLSGGLTRTADAADRATRRITGRWPTSRAGTAIAPASAPTRT